MRGVIICFILLMGSLNAQGAQCGPVHQIHLLRPHPGSAGHPIAGLDCTSWRFAVETYNLQDWKTVPGECAGHVGHYIMGAQYRKDCSAVADAAYAYVSSLALNKDGKDVWIFDIDETALSNLPYYARPDIGFGARPFNATLFNAWVREVLKLYMRLLRLGMKIVFLTGGDVAYRAARESNMRNVGYHTWELMIMKEANETGTKSVEYKSKQRTEIEEKMGFRIIGNMGDQWSDLLGPHPGLRTFKLPDPMYYIA